MANVLFIDPGGDATAGLRFWDAVNGGAFDSSVKNTGLGSLRLTRSAGDYIQKNAVLADAGRRISFWFRLSDVPPSLAVPFLYLNDGSDVDVVHLDVQAATGKLNFHGITGSVVLQAARWYRISFAYTISSLSVNEWRWWIDGVLDGSLSNLGLVRSGTNRLRLLSACQMGDSWFDDIYVDDGATLDDPGTVFCTAKRPTTIYYNNFDTILGTGANDERPINEANGRQQAGSGQAYLDWYNENAAYGDVDITGKTILGIRGWAWMKRGSGSAGSPAVRMDNVDYPVTLTTSPAIYFTSTVATFGQTIGARSSGAGSDTYLYECGKVIAYIGITSQNISGAGAIASAEIWGTANLYPGTIYLQGIPSGEAWGQNAQLVTPTLWLDTDEGIAGPQIIEFSGIVSGETWGTASLAEVISPTGIPSAEAWGTADLSLGALTISPSAIDSGETWGAAALIQTIAPAGIISAEAWGTAAFFHTLQPVGIASAEAWGTPILSFRLAFTGIPSVEAWGITILTQSILPAGIPSAEQWGNALIGQGINNAGAIPSGEAWGAAALTQGIVGAGAIASGETWGAAVLALNITGAGAIASAESWGTPTLSIIVLTIWAEPIPSAEAWGTPALSFMLDADGQGIPSAEGWGIPALSFSIRLVGIVSAEAWGTAGLSFLIDLDACSIASGETWGTATLSHTAITCIGIVSAEAWGMPSLYLVLVTVPVQLVAEYRLLIEANASYTPVVTLDASYVPARELEAVL